MRKITSLLLALVCTVGAWAEGVATVDAIQNGYIYTIASTRNAITWDGSDTKCVGAALDANNVNHRFVAIKSSIGDDCFYFYNVGANKFMSKEGGNASLVDSYAFYWKVKGSNDATWPLMIDAQDGDHFNFGGAGQITIDGWSTADAGNKLQIVEVEAADEALLTAITEKARRSDVVHAIQPIVSGASDVRVGAYSISAVAALSAAMEAFNADKSDANYSTLETEYNNFVEGSPAVNTLSPGEKFVLKCIDSARGYLVYSTVEGKGSETEPWIAGTNYSSQPDNVDAEGVYKEWTYVTVDDNKYLFNVQKKMAVATTNGEPVEFANRGTAFELISGVDGVSNIKMGNGYLASAASWNGNHPVRKTGLDNGAKFYIEKVGISVEDALLAEMTLTATYGSVDEWKNTQLSVLGYVGGYAKSEQSNIESITDLAGIEAFVTGNHEVVEPVDGGYYFVQTAKNQTAGQGAYLSYTGTDCRVYSLGVGEKPGIQHVWQFNAPTDGGFKLMSCNLGAYLQTGEAPAASTIAADMNNGFKYNLTINSEAEITIKDGNDKVLRTEGSNKNFIVNQWTSGSTNMNTEATWYIIPAEDIYVSLSAEDTKGAWATAHLPFGVNLPAENLKAYAVTATENNSATLTEVQNIPANQGVILNGTAGEHRLTINKDAAWDGVDNKLCGTNVNTPFSEAAYVLAKPETEVGLYKAAMTDGVWLNNANKAYLPASAVSAGAPFLVFDFGTETGIQGVNANANMVNGAIYDLSGRRVKAATKGIFIINGKKVIK